MCVCVCLCVCEQDYAKTTEWILLKFSGNDPYGHEQR